MAAACLALLGLVAASHSAGTPQRRLAFLPRSEWVESEHPFTEFGRARYEPRNLDIPPTWTDVARMQNPVGRVCEKDRGAQQCGEELVCREGMCRHCVSDADCAGDRHCMKPFRGYSTCMYREKHVWHRFFTEPGEFFCTVFIWMASVLSAAAGVGGGGMFVPLLLLLSHLKPQYTVPLSQCMIMFASIVNICIFVSQRHPDFPSQSKIDYNCAVLLEPMLLFGVTLGVVVNQIMPQWLLVVLLCITLGIAFQRTFQKGVKQWQTENKATAQKSLPLKERGGYDEVVELTNRNLYQVLGFLSLFAAMLALSFHGYRACSWSFAVLLVVMGIALVGATFLFSEYIVRESEHEEPRPIAWANDPTGKNSVLTRMRYPGMSFAAGFLGGMLGLGGGIVMSPVLIEVGMHSEAVQATTVMFVFVSSSLATIQYLVIGLHVWDYALWYSAMGVSAALLGQWLCNVYVRPNKRYSFITLSIAGVLILSLFALSIVGVMQVWQDIQTGAPMGFTMAKLCAGSGSSITTMDVQAIPEADAIPKFNPY